MTFIVVPNRWKSDGAKSGLYGGRGNAIQHTSLSDAIIKTDYMHAIWCRLMELSGKFKINVYHISALQFFLIILTKTKMWGKIV
jgi:hypothetical protein